MSCMDDSFINEVMEVERTFDGIEAVAKFHEEEQESENGGDE